MGKAIDKALLTLFGTIFLFVLFYTIMDSLFQATFASLLALCSIALVMKLIRPRSSNDRLSLRDFIRYILLNGNKVLKEMVERSFPKDTQLLDADGNTVVSDQNERYLLYYAFKFGALSEEDVAKCYRLAKQYEAKGIYALTNHSERKALAVTEYIPQRFSIISASTLYRYLSKRGLIPSKTVFMRKKTKILNFLHVIVNGSNVKYYLICSASASLISIITPFRIYYLVFAFLNLLLAVLSLVFSEKNAGNCELFKR